MEEISKIEIGETGDNEKKPHKLGKWLVIPPVIFLVFALILVIPGVFVFNSAKAVVSESQSLKEAFKTKDLNLISQKIVATKKSVESLERSLLPYSWLGVIPWVGNYEQDAVHLVKTGKYGLETGEIIIEAIKPYADLLGFAGGTQLAGGEKTAEGRITLLVATLDKITPDLDRIAEKAKLAQKETGQINPRRYPVEFRGQKIREPLTELISLVNEGATLASDAKPLLVNASWFLGNETPRRYLLLLQNDGELRPTGGFITAYAILEVDKGRIKPVLSEDIYALDNKYKPTLQAPEALRSYVPFPYSQDPKWRLRDMNLSPDFAVSMQTFLPEFQKAAKLKYDGVIAVDTEVLVKFLVALGQIGVPGWGNFSAVPDKNCDGCPQVVYELEKLITKPLNKVVTERKAVLGPLMHSILANAMGSPKEKLPGLFDAVFASAQEKHVLLFVPEEKIQKAVESFNLAGRIKDYDGDYFHLNDTNFAGAKVNIFLKQEVEQKVEIGRDGTVTKTVTITYKNPTPPSDCNLERGGLCLNAPYRDWVRLYVTKGAKLLSSSGLEGEVKIYEDLGKTVFEGFYGDKYPLRPQGQAKISFQYELPGKIKGDYKILIQKQPGTKGHLYTLQVNKQTEEFELKGDKELKFRI